jgi:hypothetical protein
MKEIVLAGVLAAIATAAIVNAPAYAADAGAQVQLCAAALDAKGLAPAGEYRTKFVKIKGGAVQTVTVKLVPTADGAATVEGECEIRRGEVVDATVKA